MDIEVEAPVDEIVAEEDVEEPMSVAMTSFRPTCTTSGMGTET